MSELLYILEGHEPKVCPDPVEWARWFEQADRIVGYYTSARYEVSTVFLGIDHGFSLSPSPILFETMVFRVHDGFRGDEIITERYTTWEAAEAGHRAYSARYA